MIFYDQSIPLSQSINITQFDSKFIIALFVFKKKFILSQFINHLK
jgi:hypothetical protein